MPELGNRTRFEFPFNNPEEDAKTDAFAEVEAGLSELAETTLLFLSHLESISWQIGASASGESPADPALRESLRGAQAERRQTTTSSHFLKFDRAGDGLEKQRVAVAFALDFLPNVQAVRSEAAPLAKQLRIVPATPGRVAVFFPAEKETSGLRFHLHAPFVPELSRASIKETPANLPLFEQLAGSRRLPCTRFATWACSLPTFLLSCPTRRTRSPLATRYRASPSSRR